MQSFSDPESKRESHGRRVAALTEKLSAFRCPSKESVFELCNDFDEAAEFAALEGNSIAEAIAGFIEERWNAAGCRELAGFTGYGSPAIDITGMSLPVVPKHISQLLRISSEERIPVEELEDIAVFDPVLAGRLLGHANSAAFESQSEVVRLRDAIMRLGVTEAHRILLGTCFTGLFASKPLQDLWKHSETVAQVAYDLALWVGVEAQTACVAGLLHDIGRLGFTKLPAKVRIQEQEWLAAGFPVSYAETLAYGVDHATLGAQVLRAWELPAGIIRAVRLHHRPECSASPIAAVVSLAEDFTARATDMASEDLWPGMRRTAACLTLGITSDQLDKFYGRHSPGSRACGQQM
jgi:putative nucleotidyltransferase with HDIG domain